MGHKTNRYGYLSLKGGRIMHKHSLAAYNHIMSNGSTTERKKVILQVFENFGCLSNWAVLQILKPGSDNLNFVAPRITDLHTLKILEEGPPTKSHESNLNVRTSKIRNFEQQLALF